MLFPDSITSSGSGVLVGESSGGGGDGGVALTPWCGRSGLSGISCFSPHAGTGLLEWDGFSWSETSGTLPLGRICECMDHGLGTEGKLEVESLRSFETNFFG